MLEAKVQSKDEPGGAKCDLTRTAAVVGVATIMLFLLQKEGEKGKSLVEKWNRSGVECELAMAPARPTPNMLVRLHAGELLYDGEY